LDRLFLAFLIQELADSLVGRRIRSVAEGDAEQGLALSLSPPGPRQLVVNLVRNAAGVYFGSPFWDTRPTRPLLRKWLTGASLRNVQVAELDRTVSMDLERVRLSGRAVEFSLQLEIAGTRADVYLIERPENRVVEGLPSSGSRLEVGDTFRERTPPPGAQPVAADEATLRSRLGVLDPGWEGGVPGRSQLLRASGLTPALTDDLLWMLREGTTIGDALTGIHGELRKPRPTLLVPVRGKAGPDSCIYAPIPPLRPIDETRYLVRRMESFNEAMREGARIADEIRRFTTLHREITSAIHKRSASVESLRDKLMNQLEALPDAEQARRHGERLLAGHASARSPRPGFVVLPDAFDQDAADVEVPIDPRFNLVTNAKRWFERSKKTERTHAAVESRMARLSHEMEYLETLGVAVANAETSRELEELRADIVSEAIVPMKPRMTRARTGTSARNGDRGRKRHKFAPRRFQTRDGFVVLVGRSAKGNEDLTFRIARPHDLWLHASGRAGSHVVLVRREGEGKGKGKRREPTAEAVEQAAGLAAYYSKGRNDSYVEVLVTERRNVRKLSGAPPGTVRVDSSRSVRVRPALIEEIG
jgi:predicted ribosome quality control (RQC) complex YloA/Tae2 family protein